jgi:acetylornithine deacetylase/succinyl-diaminopimelate desuccinylase-like protein
MSASLFSVTATLAAIPAQNARESIDELLRDPTVQLARKTIRDLEPQTIDTQVTLCEIPAPPFGESRRAAAVRALFEAAGLTRVRIDRAGNVLGERAGRAPSPSVVLSAHLDTVFPQGTDVRVRRSGTTLRGPGITDDCRGLAVLIAVARALKATGAETAGSLTFVATVGEEGLGNLRGVRHLFESELRGKVDRFLSLDGAGMAIVSRGVGSRRYRITFSGAGGHSYGSFGIANPIHTLGRAINAIAGMSVPAGAKATFNVGRIGGGTSINAIASEAWMEVDLRSSSAELLAKLEAQMRTAVANAVASENRRWGGRDPVSAAIQTVGERPGGATDDRDPLVRSAQGVSAALGASMTLSESSTDANIPMSLGIPAITIGAGGEGGGEHSLEEIFKTEGSALGSERALLIALAASSTDR